MLLSSLILLSLSPLAYSAVVPTTPGADATYAVGSSCPIAWNTDTTGTWTNLTIQLMSGSNTAMTVVTPVVYGLDGTQVSSYTWKCPKVTPYSEIYFYQFTNGDDVTDAAWTTRFAISTSSGKTSTPANATQPDGDAIPWGTGQLVSSYSVDDASGSSSDSSSASVASSATRSSANRSSATRSSASASTTSAKTTVLAATTSATSDPTTSSSSLSASASTAFSDSAASELSAPLLAVIVPCMLSLLL